MEIRRPQTDDRPLWDAFFGIAGYPALLVAHRLKLFPLLAEQPKTLSEVQSALALERRPAKALLAVATATGFLRLEEGRYSLTQVSRDYLLDSSPTYFGHLWDIVADIFPVYDPKSLDRGMRTNRPQVYGGQDIFEEHAAHEERARSFTLAMHSASIGPALAWPELVDLSNCRRFLDIGGGSGAHSIGVALKWPNLQAVVFDIPPVCEVANELIGQQELNRRISTHVGDMWDESPFPDADVHFYSNIYHDWPPEKGQFLTAKSYESLDPGGRIILHEVVFNDDKTGPFPVAAFNISMLQVSEGEQYSGSELATMLTDAGFQDAQVTPAFGYNSLITAIKPE
jgi:SAM-dependent methyltransferase